MTDMKRQRGMGMVDVLAAAAIFAVGVMALLRLQGSLLDSSGGAGARSIALSIAQAKLDDLRTFQQTNSGNAATFDFTDIGDNAGGAFAGQSAYRYQDADCAAPCPTMPAGNIVLGNTVYNLGWTSADRNVVCTPAATCATISSAAPSAGTVYPHQKEVAVTVSWVDRANTRQSVALNGIVNSIAPAASALVLGGGGLGGALGGGSPQVAYTPGLAPDVIPIDLDWGGGGKRETTAPKPSIVAHGQTVENNTVSFATVNYDLNDKLQSKEEFVSVDCRCNLRGSGAGTDMTGRTVTKAHTGVPSDAFQSRLCNACCNDHHESSDQTSIGGMVTVTGSGHVDVKATPNSAACSNTAVIGGKSSYICTVPTTAPGWSGLITATCSGGSQSAAYDNVTTPQSHDYHLNCAGGNAKPAINAGLSSGVCDPDSAFGKVGCYDPYRAGADYGNGDHNHYHKLGAGDRFEPASGTTGNGSNAASYYLESCRFKRIEGAFRLIQDWRQIKLNAFDEAELNGNVGDYKAYLSRTVLAYAQAGATPSAWGRKAFAMSANRQPLMARAIYVDYLDHLDANQKAALTITQIPFYEFNVTDLADWTPTDDAPNSEGQTPTPGCANHSVCVTSPSVSRLAENNASSKGVVEKTHAAPPIGTVTVEMKTGNSGVTGSTAVDAEDWTLPATAHDSLTLTIP